MELLISPTSSLLEAVQALVCLLVSFYLQIKTNKTDQIKFERAVVKPEIDIFISVTYVESKHWEVRFVLLCEYGSVLLI